MVESVANPRALAAGVGGRLLVLWASCTTAVYGVVMIPLIHMAWGVGSPFYVVIRSVCCTYFSGHVCVHVVTNGELSHS